MYVTKNFEYYVAMVFENWALSKIFGNQKR
jgi:hypothetical protein